MSTVWVHAAAGCAAIASWLYKAPSCHDSRLPGVELSEAEFVIEIENDQKLISGPSHPGSHGPRQAAGGAGGEQELI